MNIFKELYREFKILSRYKDLDILNKESIKKRITLLSRGNLRLQEGRYITAQYIKILKEKLLLS